jgi:hypothetical protein
VTHVLEQNGQKIRDLVLGAALRVAIVKRAHPQLLSNKSKADEQGHDIELKFQGKTNGYHSFNTRTDV